MKVLIGKSLFCIPLQSGSVWLEGGGRQCWQRPPTISTAGGAIVSLPQSGFKINPEHAHLGYANTLLACRVFSNVCGYWNCTLAKNARLKKSPAARVPFKRHGSFPAPLAVRVRCMARSCRGSYKAEAAFYTDLNEVLHRIGIDFGHGHLARAGTLASFLLANLGDATTARQCLLC